MTRLPSLLDVAGVSLRIETRLTVLAVAALIVVELMLDTGTVRDVILSQLEGQRYFQAFLSVLCGISNHDACNACTA